MAFFLRRSVSSVFARVVGCRRSLYNTAFTPPTGGITPAAPAASLLSRRNHSDKRLLEAVDSEIQLTLKPYEHYKTVEIPRDFPFKIWEDPWDDRLTLVGRYYRDEIETSCNYFDTINVEVELQKDDKDKSSEPRLRLVVRTVSRVDKIFLEFICYAFREKLTIDSISSPSFNFRPFADMHEMLQKGFYEYLEKRGISMSAANYLRKYLTNSLSLNADDRRYLIWLQGMKHVFIKT